jgi:serine/threonine protein kinase
VAVARVLGGSDPALTEPVVAASLDALLVGVPGAIAKLVSAVVRRTIELPKETREGATTERRSHRVVEALPAWLPPRRTIGGFYVVRALSAGAVGSVFVATRIEDKGDETAERFALKVPEFSATAARSLSEAEFLKLFREEAGALLALPQHPNLARFVTFDAGCKPKPILVMELVEGTTLESLIQAGDLTIDRATRILTDLLHGLEAMHAVGVGHLDVKPSNVVLRRGEEAVLVDFGLSGKHVRPGCATGPYGAPEVWGALEGAGGLDPAKADVYAFGCVLFEALTGRALFEADSEMAQIAAHLTHDGFPPAIRAMARKPGLSALAELCFATLRRFPRDRPSAAAARKELSRLAPALARLPWPLDVS